MKRGCIGVIVAVLLAGCGEAPQPQPDVQIFEPVTPPPPPPKPRVVPPLPKQETVDTDALIDQVMDAQEFGVSSAPASPSVD
jgi:hypothetical protein